MKKMLLFLPVLLISFIHYNSQTIWELAKENMDVFRVSTLFTAQNVKNYLSDKDEIYKAIDWCKNTGVTRVFLETFRGGYTVDRNTIVQAKKMFESAGIETAGCVTTTRIGKPATTGGQLSCYTNSETRKQLQKIFEFTASIFDLIMIDDFFMTNCQCEECQAGRGEKSMGEYRGDLMYHVSLDYVIKPAKAVNPKVKIILKYPLWYDFFHWRGYDVIRETLIYDYIWVGTETRDYDYYINNFSGDVQYKAYFIMRWLGNIGKTKTGGGWFDHLQTSSDTYVEQARQTVLADAREMVLFCYSEGIENIDNIEKLRRELPDLFKLARMVQGKPIKGIHAPKPANSDAYDNFNATEPFIVTKPDVYIYDFIGMMGIPLLPSTEVNPSAMAAFFSVQALKEPHFKSKLISMLGDKKPVLITESLADTLKDVPEYESLTVLPVNGDTHSLLKMGGEELNALRNKMLEPFGIKMDAPNKVALYLIGDDMIIIENFNITPVQVRINTTFSINPKVDLVIPRERTLSYQFDNNSVTINRLPQRTLAVIKY